MHTIHIKLIYTQAYVYVRISICKHINGTGPLSFCVCAFVTSLSLSVMVAPKCTLNPKPLHPQTLNP